MARFETHERVLAAIAARLALPEAAMPPKASMTPQTVPRRPTKGAPLTAVERMIIWDSSRREDSPTARSIAACTERIWAGVMRSAYFKRDLKVSSTSVDPSTWKQSSSQPA